MKGRAAAPERRAVLRWKRAAGSSRWLVELEVDGAEPEEASVDPRAIARLDLEAGLRRGLGNRRGVERLPAEGEAKVRLWREKGRDLWSQLLPDPIGKRLLRLIEQVNREETRLRIEIVEPSRQGFLTGLPWELLWVPGVDRFLGLQDRVTLTRRVSVGRPSGSIPRKAPRLLVVDASPAGYGSLETAAEWELLREALATAGISPPPRRLAGATRSALEAELRQQPADVLHFMGHGQGPEASSDAGLLFEAGDGGADRVDGSELADLMSSAQGELPALVVLNACHSGASDELSGVAADLLAAGVPAVVAMRWQITDKAAVCFAAAFYAGLARGERVDVALTRARREVNGKVPGLEWSLPVLYEAARGAERGKEIQTGPFARPPRWARSPWGWVAVGLALAATAGAWLIPTAEEPPMPGLTSDLRCPRVSEVDLPMAYLPAAPEAGVPMPFCLAKTELTEQQWAAIQGKAAPTVREQRRPKGSLTWADSHELLARLNALDGKARFRLPTQDEWISAARFGQTKQTAFTFGDDENELVRHGNCESEGEPDGHKRAVPVASFRPSAAGLFDLHGNLAEWVVDRGGASQGGTQSGEAGAEAKHLRLGGSYESKPSNCRIGEPSWSGAKIGLPTSGLRVAAEPLPAPEG